MDALTDRQSEILKLIRELTEVSGFPPTRAEIAERMMWLIRVVETCPSSASSASDLTTPVRSSSS